jgi:pyruvate dehydrogenase E2 component (dihydrolipoamide acetyltransferase)
LQKSSIVHRQSKGFIAMLKDVTLPEISENVDSGEVIAVLVSVGDVVEKDQPLVELETEKAAFEVPSPSRGLVTEVNVKQGQTVKVGEVLARLQTDGQAGAAPAPKPPQEAREKPREIAEVREEPTVPPPPKELEREEAAAPAPRPTPAPQAARAEPQPEPEKLAPGVPVAAAPSVRQLARELGLDINRVPGTGPGGRVSQEDVKQYARGLISGRPAGAQPTAAAARAAARPLPDFAQWGQVERQPMSKTRRTIADTISYGWNQIPHVTQYDRADITEVEAFRKAHSPAGEAAGGRLSITSILVKLVASALKVFPQFNASVDSERDEIIYKQYYHIAVAVDTDRGLLVPVIRDADRKGIRQIAAELAELAQKARNRQITAEEMQGGCFTVSNLGGLGGTNFSPIIYWPQVAILGVARSTWEAVPRDGAIQPRFLLPLSLSYDHRLIDGADGTRFLRWLVQALEQPLTMML